MSGGPSTVAELVQAVAEEPERNGSILNLLLAQNSEMVLLHAAYQSLVGPFRKTKSIVETDELFAADG